mmetsp:Transcript_31694/g.94166  ORF Transcript_31694/g.94166 Transcript_31694/m.94166 type:complete len:173 (+) Transcript_31694:225-743(+)
MGLPLAPPGAPAPADPMAFVAADPAPAPAAADPFPAPAAADPFGGMSGGGGGGGAPERNALREWEVKHQQDLEESANKEEAAKKTKKATAAEELKKWQEDRKAADQKRIAANRADQKSSEASIKEALKPGANPWERVVGLIDTNARPNDDVRDTSRMRSLLIQLKSNPITAA